MTNLEKIDYMIQSLQIAKEEISYAQKWTEKYKIDAEHCWTERIPNGTIIRESLKMVGRMANIVANNVVFSPYSKDVFKHDES